jgi:membrane protein DedA with SNARE-associated domain
MLEALSSAIIHLIQLTGYIGVFILTGASATAIPFPVEVTLPFSGFLANQGNLYLIFVIIAGVLGDVAGSTVGYMIGYLLEENLLLSLIKKFGKFILVTEHEYHKATNWVKKYGTSFIFIGKMIPGVRSFIAIASGITEFKFKRFILIDALSSLIYFSIMSYFGFYLGSKWNIVGVYFRKFDLIIAILLIIAVLLYINYKLKIVKFKKAIK